MNTAGIKSLVITHVTMLTNSNTETIKSKSERGKWFLDGELIHSGSDS